VKYFSRGENIVTTLFVTPSPFALCCSLLAVLFCKSPSLVSFVSCVYFAFRTNEFEQRLRDPEFTKAIGCDFAPPPREGRGIGALQIFGRHFTVSDSESRLWNLLTTKAHVGNQNKTSSASSFRSVPQ